ncbi:hypothetical protein LC55x_2022 [Lysobacter capsici]|nr:hypothetical protein LC55x_2022 [Lysobacter capsici]
MPNADCGYGRADSICIEFRRGREFAIAAHAAPTVAPVGAARAATALLR